jgi:archaeosine synthase beta-subunit
VTAAPYPEEPSARRKWIEERRGPRHDVDPSRPHAFFVEQECSESGAVVPIITVFLTNRECPWRCLMCDLWKDTLDATVPNGAIPAQIDYALAKCNLPGTDPLAEGSVPGKYKSWEIKLYNSGSFFDRRAVPIADHAEIARRVSGFRRVIVECHPKLISEEVPRFRDLIGIELEIAMGLETAHPDVLARLNKGMTLEDFASATKFLTSHGIAVRAFTLLKPPFTTEAEGVSWAKRSIDFAFDCGVSVACVIPTRPGNGALEVLASRGEFSSPRLDSLEAVLDYGVSLNRGRVFADLWDLERFSTCPGCVNARRERLNAINLTQQPRARVICPKCEG